MDLETYIKKLSKAEVHVHLDGSVIPDTLYELSKRYDWLPQLSLDEYKQRMRVPATCKSLPEYLATFQFVLPCLQRAEVLERVAYDLVVQADQDNVRYLEVRFSPGLHLHHGLAVDEVIESVLKGLKQGEEHFGIKTGLIICGIREKDPGFSLLLVEKAAKYREFGVVAVDLAGDEVHFPAELHAKAFERAYALGLNITIHAGEARGAESIRDAIDKLHARRIGHGIRLYEDEELLELVKEKQIPLEVCPTSNIHTRTVKSYEEHPARGYFEKGLLVTINTDNRTASNVSLNQEYENVARKWRLDEQALRQIAINGFKAAFLPEDEKLELITKFFK